MNFDKNDFKTRYINVGYITNFDENDFKTRYIIGMMKEENSLYCECDKILSMHLFGPNIRHKGFLYRFMRNMFESGYDFGTVYEEARTEIRKLYERSKTWNLST